MATPKFAWSFLRRGPASRPRSTRVLEGSYHSLAADDIQSRGWSVHSPENASSKIQTHTAIASFSYDGQWTRSGLDPSN
jgi:hypothetical protein